LTRLPLKIAYLGCDDPLDQQRVLLDLLPLLKRLLLERIMPEVVKFLGRLHIHLRLDVDHVLYVLYVLLVLAIFKLKLRGQEYKLPEHL
jgi:hypothetical protein